MGRLLPAAELHRMRSAECKVQCSRLAILVLAFNLNSAIKRMMLGGEWVNRLLKAMLLRASTLTDEWSDTQRGPSFARRKGAPYDLLVKARWL